MYYVCTLYLHCIPVYTTPLVLFLCSQYNVYSKGRAHALCVGKYKYNYNWCRCVRVYCARSLSSLARKAACDRGSYASLIVTYTRCYLQCECYRRFCAVVRPFVSGFWRNCGVTRCKIAQNSCAKSRKIAAIAWYTT